MKWPLPPKAYKMVVVGSNFHPYRNISPSSNHPNELTQVNVGPNIATYFSWLTNAVENIRTEVRSFTIGEVGGITDGTKGIGLQIGATSVIKRVDIFSDVVGNIEIDLWRCEPNNYPPSINDSIVGIEPVRLTNTHYASVSISTWDTKLYPGDIIFYNVNSASNIELVTVQLHTLSNHTI